MRILIDTTDPDTCYADLREGEELTEDLCVEALIKADKYARVNLEIWRKGTEADDGTWLMTWAKRGGDWTKIKERA